MNEKKSASIDLDNIRQRKLGDMSAADFLVVLSKGDVLPIHHLIHWPEKKKYELWVEPEHNHTIGNIIDFIGEKKKVELEKPVAVEHYIDVNILVRDPDFIRQVANEVAKRIQG